MIGVEHRARVTDVEGLVGTRAPWHVEDRVEPRSDPPLLGVLVAGALESIELADDRLADAVGDVALVEARAVLRDDVVVALPQLLADGIELASQQELALLLLHPVGHLGTDLLGELELGERVTCPGDGEREPLLDVDRLEQLDLAFEGEVGPPARRVGERAGLRDAGQRILEPSAAEALGDRSDDGPVLLRQLAGAVGRLLGVTRRIGLDPDGRPAPRDADADDGPEEPAQHHCIQPVRQLAGALDPRDGADPGVAPVDPRDEEQQPVAGGRGLGGGPGLLGLEHQASPPSAAGPPPWRGAATAASGARRPRSGPRTPGSSQAWQPRWLRDYTITSPETPTTGVGIPVPGQFQPGPGHVLGADQLVELLGGQVAELDRRLLQGLPVVVGVLGDRGGLVVADVRVERGHEHQRALRRARRSAPRWPRCPRRELAEAAAGVGRAGRPSAGSCGSSPA